MVFHVASGEVKRVHPIKHLFAEPNAAPNDIRFRRRHAFILESGVGSIVVLNLDTRSLRRVLPAPPAAGDGCREAADAGRWRCAQRA
ncbi:MAG TPA: hypothetical protein VIL30_15000 [Ramlibacter sp.]